jgi:hypothetical protein
LFVEKRKKRQVVYNLIYVFLKLMLLLQMTTVNVANVERVFSATSVVKNKLRNNIGDKLLNHW